MKTFITALLVIMAAVPVAAGAVVPDPWYSDMSGHWSEPEVRVLWEEEVTDGHQFGSGSWMTAWFMPDQFITRAEHAMIMAKVFRLTQATGPSSRYTDVQPGLTLYGNKPAYGWVEASIRDTLVRQYPGELFWPSLYLERGDAVSSLVLALGLEPYALSLSPAQVELYLARFTDSSAMDPEIRHLIAAAVRLRILRGYPDNTLRLRSYLRRSEAASLIHRSCLFRITPPVSPFYPDGDGVDEEADLVLHTLKNRNASSWRVAIADNQDIEIWDVSGVGVPPPAVTWDGRSWQGQLLPPGTYFAQGAMTDLKGNSYEAVPVPVYLEQRTLIGMVDPPAGRSGDSIHLVCHTTGRPASVTMVHPLHLALAPVFPASSYTNQWHLLWQLGDEPAGPLPIQVIADFGATTRALTLLFSVVDDLTLTGWLEPDAVPAGTSITIHARTTGDVESVAVTGQQQTEFLEEGEDGRWISSWPIPLGTPPGEYGLLLTAHSSGGQRQVMLYYCVQGSLRDLVEFVLTD